MWTVDPTKIITAEQKAAEAKAALLATYKAAFDAHLDAVAQERQYDNRVTVGTYVASSNPQYVAEAQAFIEWRDQALASMFSQLADVESGGVIPSVADFIAALPTITWP